MDRGICGGEQPGSGNRSRTYMREGRLRSPPSNSLVGHATYSETLFGSGVARLRRLRKESDFEFLAG